jgi:hypothetical protein
MICNKCKIDKEINNFQVYWHSTHQKSYTRKECTECLYTIRNKKRREKTLLKNDPSHIFKDNPNYKKCYRCSNYNELSSYLAKTGHRYSYCYDCRLKESRDDAEQELIDTMGGYNFYQKPNKYYNDLQKQGVFNIMKALNWQFNEEKGIWFKSGIKDENNNWVNLNKKIVSKTKFKPTPEIIEKAINLRKKGKTKLEIAIELNCGETSVYKILLAKNIK